MPQFYKVYWRDHEIDIGTGDNWRKILRTLTFYRLFGKDLLPYLNQVPLVLSCKVTPPQRLKATETLTCEWRLRGLTEDTICYSKIDTLNVTPNEKRKATQIVSDIIQYTIQYVGEIRISRSISGLKEEQWQPFMSLTVLDRDVYSMTHIMIRLVDLLWIILGAGITLLIQKLLGII